MARDDIQLLQKILREFSRSKKAWDRIGGTMVDRQKRRIHDRGIKSSGRSIGRYSNDRYRIRKAQLGFPSFVNLQLTGSQRRDYRFKFQGKRGISGFTLRKNAQKVARQEKRYGDVYDLTKEEELEYAKIAEETLMSFLP